MWKWLIMIVVTVTLVVGGTAAAQDTPDLAAFVPADTAAVIQLDASDPNAALLTMNAAYFSASLMQPNRVVAEQGGFDWDRFLPFASWFTVDGVSFAGNIQPWLRDHLLIAYRDFDGGLNTRPDDILLILSNTDLVSAAAGLSPIIGAQVGMVEETYRGLNVYADKTVAIALTTPAVFIGAPDLVRAALDVQAGAAPALGSDSLYREVRDSLPQAAVSAYVTGDHLLAGVNGILNGLPDSQPLLAAFGEALAQTRPEPGWLERLLNGGYDAAGAALLWDESTFQAQAQVRLHGAVDLVPELDLPADLLDFVPRSALMAHAGTNLRTFLFDSLTAAPMSNFARELLGGLPIQTGGTASELIAVPTSSQLQAAVSAFLVNLARYQQIDLQGDLLDYLGESYVLALLPRPNSPLPLLNTPFDLLLLTTSPDAEAGAVGLEAVLGAFFQLTAGEPQAAEDWTLTSLSIEGETEPVFTVGVNGDRLLLTTGRAAESAIQAVVEPLTESEPWLALNPEAVPDLYIDLASFTNTFFPSPGGFTLSEDLRSRMTLRAERSGTMDALTLTVALPTG